MARVVLRSETPAADETAAWDKAFSMYMKLDHRFEPVYSLPQIAAATGISATRLETKIYRLRNNRWRDLLDQAIERARAIAGRKAAKLDSLRRRRAKTVNQTVEGLADVIYEVRAYNFLMFEQLMALSGSDSHDPVTLKKRAFRRMRLPIKSRFEAHRAWVESLEQLQKLMGATTIRDVAAEIATHRSDSTEPAAPSPNPPPPSPDTPRTPSIPLDGDPATIPIDAAGYELILRMMQGEGGKIGGPINYTGPKETSIVEGVEDAVITSPHGADSEG